MLVFANKYNAMHYLSRPWLRLAVAMKSRTCTQLMNFITTLLSSKKTAGPGHGPREGILCVADYGLKQIRPTF